MTTEQLLSESVEDARVRESRPFPELLWKSKRSIVLWGAGTLGLKVLRALREAGIEPLGFADNQATRSSLEGLPVIPLEAAVKRWGVEALFVVTIFRPLGGKGMREHLEELSSRGCCNVCSFLQVGWSLPGILPHFGADRPSCILEHRSDLDRVSRLWSDRRSQEIFRQQLLWRLHGNFSEIEHPSPEQYFPRDLLIPSTTERIVDGGAFDGDTLRSMPVGFERAWAIEPDPLNLAKLRANPDARIEVLGAALGDKAGESSFNALGSTASSLALDGAITVRVATLDDLLEGQEPTYLKLDVEGAETAALRGARVLLQRTKPVVAACLYHKVPDLWEVPLLLSEVLPGHRLGLRVHEWDNFELVAYAVPRDRCP